MSESSDKGKGKASAPVPKKLGRPPGKTTKKRKAADAEVQTAGDEPSSSEKGAGSLVAMLEMLVLGDAQALEAT